MLLHPHNIRMRGVEHHARVHAVIVHHGMATHRVVIEIGMEIWVLVHGRPVVAEIRKESSVFGVDIGVVCFSIRRAVLICRLVRVI